MTMPTIHQTRVEDHYLHVASEGEMNSAAEMLDYIKALYDCLAQAGLSRILIDETRCHMHINFDGLKEVAWSLTHAEEFKDIPKTAVIASNANHPLFQLFFDSLRTIKVFTNEDTAKKWLTS